MALGPSLCPEQGGTCHSQDHLAKENKPDPGALSCPSLCSWGALVTEPPQTSLPPPEGTAVGRAIGKLGSPW